MKNDNKLITCLLGGVEVPAGTEGGEPVYTEPLDIKHSCELAPDKPLPWRAALYVTADGVQPEKSASAALRGGKIGDACADGIAVESRSDDFSALIVDGGRYRLSNVRINMPTNSDGKKVCDFAGLGSAAAVFNGGLVELDNCDITTEGVAKCMVYADNASDVVIKNCRMEAKG